MDFFCPRLKLIIEIDGESHSERLEKDRTRKARLESLGFYFLRFWDSEVKQNLEGVLLTIKDWIEKHKK